MVKAHQKNAQAAAQKSAGQAATELAVFGAILIFVIGTIMRTAVGNSYTQNQNFKAMRMAMLASWTESKSNPGAIKAQATSHNSASILFVEDRLSPDSGKYGDLDRNPFTAQGSGSFSYNLLYPLSDGQDVNAGVPIMDVYINGLHFPFTMASYVSDKAFIPPGASGAQVCPAGGPYSEPNLTQGQCQQNQCLRNQREWVGGVKESSFNSTAVAPITSTTDDARKIEMSNNACNIFTALANAGVFSASSISQVISQSGSLCGDPNLPSPQVNIDPTIIAGTALQDTSQWNAFTTNYEQKLFLNSSTKSTAAYYNPYFQAILKILTAGQVKYKLFYSLAANRGDNSNTDLSSASAPPFLPSSSGPPNCTSHPCKDQELSLDLVLGGHPNQGVYVGDLMYDLRRLGEFGTNPGGADYNPSFVSSTLQRDNMTWQWAATAGTVGGGDTSKGADPIIGLDPNNNQFPTYDIDGRLKEVTIYKAWLDSGNMHVAFEDPQGGDIDGSWDVNSCSPKPGLKTDSQIFTYTRAGTYLQVNEGKLYNPETGQAVRSANKRNTIDLIQRTIQLSNNTGRFCTSCKDGSFCGAIVANQCADGKACSIPLSSYLPSNGQAPVATLVMCKGLDCANPNPVETCVDHSTTASPCFTPGTIAETCYDTAINVIFVRSRLQDQRGHFWLSNTSGQWGVGK